MSAIIMSAIETLVFKSGVVKTSVVEISVVVSFKVGTIVGIVKAIAIVSVPGGIGIIGISGELVLICNAIISVLVYRGWCGGIAIIAGWCALIYDRSRGDISGAGRNIHSCAGDTEANVCVDIYLRIAFSSDEAGSYEGGKNK
jgi:uncharacterized membrane protein YgdD (TMEM256/DUF423 family)